MTFFDVRIPELMMTIVSADGNNVEPIVVDEFRIGVAETYDVIVEPKTDRAYPLFAQSLDRTGYALGSLTPSSNILASAPKMDAVPILTHVDMGSYRKYGALYVAINGIKYADAKPLQFHYGERLRITYINDTMMNHPMHLHGMWSDLETGENQLVRKHTVVVQPGSKISMQVTVDAKGEWAYHCHLLYHMGGMFRKVVVS